MVVKLAKIEHRVVQNRVQRLAGGFDGRVVAAFERRQQGARGSVYGRKNRQAKRADQQTEGIEPSDRRRSEAGGNQPSEQDGILSRLPALIPVCLDALLAALGLGGHVADEVLQRAHGADPAAEKAPQKERGNQDEQAPQQAAVESVAGQRVHQGHQRIPFKVKANGRAQLNLGRAADEEIQRGKEQQRKEQQQKEHLRDPATHRQPGTSHDNLPNDARACKPYRGNDCRSTRRQTVTCITGSDLRVCRLCLEAVRQLTSVEEIGGAVGRGFIPGNTTALSHWGFNLRVWQVAKQVSYPSPVVTGHRIRGTDLPFLGSTDG